MYVWDVLLRCEVFCGSQQLVDHTVPWWGRDDGSEEEEQDEKGEWKREDMVTDTCLILILQEYRLSSLSLFGPLFRFLSFLSSFRSSSILLSVRHR